MIAVAVAIRIAVGGMDDERVRDYFGERGWTIRSKTWEMFGPGWYGDKNRIYRVAFTDEKGNHREAVVKTSMMAGVFLSEDVVTQRALDRSDSTETPASEIDRLRAENERLRAELAQRGGSMTS